MSRTREKYGLVTNWNTGRQEWRLEYPMSQARMFFVTINLVDYQNTDFSQLSISQIVTILQPVKNQIDEIFFTNSIFSGCTYHGVLEFGQQWLHPHIHVVITNNRKKRAYQVKDLIHGTVITI